VQGKSSKETCQHLIQLFKCLGNAQTLTGHVPKPASLLCLAGSETPAFRDTPALAALISAPLPAGGIPPQQQLKLPPCF